ncbi:MAG: spermidine/putrescine ABC transporter substrate-binding protein [Novosphingobium sp.]
MQSSFTFHRRALIKGLGASAVGLSLPALGGCGERASLNFANWENYLGETTLADFKDANGIDVKLGAIAGEDALFDQIAKGDARLDLIVASNRLVARLLGEGLLLPLSKARIAGLRSIDPRFGDAPFDPGRKFSVPYTWLAYGIGYRRSAVAAPPRGWADLLANPAFAGRIALPADPAQLLRIVALARGTPPNTITLDDVPALAAALRDLKPRIKAFHQDDGQDLLLGRHVDLIADFNGDAAQVMLEDKDIGFVHPIEGAELTCDNLCLPMGASNSENAHRFIDYLLGGQAGMRVIETILYPTPNLAAKALMPEQYQTSTVLFPPPEVFAKLEYAPWNADVAQAMAKATNAVLGPPA